MFSGLLECVCECVYFVFCVFELLLMSCNQRQQKRPQVPSAESGQQYIYGKLNSTITTATTHMRKPVGRQSPSHTHTHIREKGESWEWVGQEQCVVSCRHCDFYCRRQLPLLLFPLQLSAAGTYPYIHMYVHICRFT